MITRCDNNGKRYHRPGLGPPGNGPPGAAAAAIPVGWSRAGATKVGAAREEGRPEQAQGVLRWGGDDPANRAAPQPGVDRLRRMRRRCRAVEPPARGTECHDVTARINVWIARRRGPAGPGNPEPRGNRLGGQALGPAASRSRPAVPAGGQPGSSTRHTADAWNPERRASASARWNARSAGSSASMPTEGSGQCRKT